MSQAFKHFGENGIPDAGKLRETMFRGGRVGGFSVGLGEQMGAEGGAQHGVGVEPLSQSGHFTDVEREAQRGQWSCPRTHSKQTAQPELVLRLAVQSAPCLPTVFLRFEVPICSVAQLCLILFNPMDHTLPGSSVHGICQARILEWVTIPLFRESS